MKEKFVSNSLISGFGLLVFYIVLMIAKLAPLFLLAVYFIPGLVFGMVIALNKRDTGDLSKIVFVIVSMAIYLLSAYLFDVRENNSVLLVIRFIIASIVGAVLLSAAFALILNKKKLTIKRTFIVPFLIGLISAVPSSFFVYYMECINSELRIVNVLIFCGIFLVFPIWQYLISLNIRRTLHN